MSLDLCSVEATSLVREAVEHVLSRGNCDEKLRRELVQWQGREGKEEREGRPHEMEYCVKDSSIPFDLVCKVHQQLKSNPLGK